MNVALYARVLQFEAGPEMMRFTACEEHVWGLIYRRLAPTCFYPVPSQELEILDPVTTEEMCDLCREGGH